MNLRIERITENFDLEISEVHSIEVEAIESLDWEGIEDTSPECEGTEYHHFSYSGGLDGHHDGVVVERTDYWFDQGAVLNSGFFVDDRSLGSLVSG